MERADGAEAALAQRCEALVHKLARLRPATETCIAGRVHPCTSHEATAFTVLAGQDASAEAAEAAAALAQRCVALARELRGTDLLAERARRLRKNLDRLEALVERVLLS